MRQYQNSSLVDASGDFLVQVARGDRVRRFRLSPGALAAVAALIVLAATALAGAAAYLMFRDDLLASLVARQTRMQYAYEDRIAALRLRLDQLASRQVINQDGVEGKVQTLVLRQAQLETRAAVVARLVERTVGGDGGSTVMTPVRPEAAAVSPPSVRPRVAQEAGTPAVPDSLAPPPGPEPERLELRGGDGEPKPLPLPPDGAAKRADAAHASAARPEYSAANTATPDSEMPDSAMPLSVRLERLALSLDRIERDQTRRLSGLVRPAVAAATRLRAAFDIAGLPVERFLSRLRQREAAAPAMGGPFVAAPDGRRTREPFEQNLVAAQSALATLDGLRRALPMTPLRKPLAGPLQMTSGFGYRSDPFLGRPALHSGVDLRDDYGAPVRATAAGVVTAAGPQGGYGNLIEIDHGGGLSTRYGHLSATSVAPGQQVQPGAVIGQVGSTGRSTGPHLHYEVRVDGEAVDPARVLRAASTLVSLTE